MPKRRRLSDLERELAEPAFDKIILIVRPRMLGHDVLPKDCRASDMSSVQLSPHYINMRRYNSVNKVTLQQRAIHAPRHAIPLNNTELNRSPRYERCMYVCRRIDADVKRNVRNLIRFM